MCRCQQCCCCRLQSLALPTHLCSVTTNRGVAGACHETYHCTDAAARVMTGPTTHAACVTGGSGGNDAAALPHGANSSWVCPVTTSKENLLGPVEVAVSSQHPDQPKTGTCSLLLKNKLTCMFAGQLSQARRMCTAHTAWPDLSFHAFSGCCIAV